MRDGVWWEKGNTENEVGEGLSLVGESIHQRFQKLHHRLDQGPTATLISLIANGKSRAFYLQMIRDDDGVFESVGVQHGLAQSMIGRLRPKSAHGLVIDSAIWSAFFKRWTSNIDEQ